MLGLWRASEQIHQFSTDGKLQRTLPNLNSARSTTFELPSTSTRDFPQHIDFFQTRNFCFQLLNFNRKIFVKTHRYLLFGFFNIQMNSQQCVTFFYKFNNQTLQISSDNYIYDIIQDNTSDLPASR